MTKNWSNGPGRNLKKLSFLIRFQYVFNTFFIQGSPGRRLSPPNFIQNSVKNVRLSAFLHHDRPKTMYCQHFCNKNIQKHCTVAIFATGPSKTDVLSAFFAPGPSKNDVLSACLRQDRPKTLYCRHFCTRTVQKRCTVSFFLASSVQKRCTVGIFAPRSVPKCCTVGIFKPEAFKKSIKIDGNQKKSVIKRDFIVERF